MRKFLVTVALFVGVMFVIGHFAELQAIAETLKRADLRFLLLAVLVELLWLVNVGTSFRVIFQTLDIEENLLHLIILVTATNFINIIAPSGGVSGVAILITESRRRGYSSARATIGGALLLLFEYLGFLVVLILGLIVLIRRDSLNASEIIASIVIVGIVLVMFSLLILGMRSAKELGSALAWIARRVNRLLHPFLHRPYLSEYRAHEFAEDAAEGLITLRRNPGNLIPPMVLALTSKALMISVLMMVFLAFKVPLSVGTLIAGFSVGYLFFIVSPTPGGVGFVEGALALALNSMFIPLSAAVVITLAYRGITFWLPFLLGMFAFRSLGQERDLPVLEEENPV